MPLKQYGVAQGYVRLVNASSSGTFAAYGVVNDGATPGSETGTDDGSYVPGMPDAEGATAATSLSGREALTSVTNNLHPGEESEIATGHLASGGSDR
jgi:hypothetical protein